MTLIEAITLELGDWIEVTVNKNYPAFKRRDN